MNYRCLSFVVGITALVSLAQGQTTPQSVLAKANAAKQTWVAPRAADGHPDLQGSWINNMATPIERPDQLAGRAFLTDAELAAFRKKADELFNGKGDAAFGDNVFLAVLANVTGVKSGFKSTDGETGDYSSVWTVKRDWDNRTSLITNPADGRLPAMTPEGQKRREENLAARNRPAAGPEDRPLQERCITYGSPSLIAGYQSGYLIVQSPTAVVVTTEMVHDSRTIRLDERTHLPSSVHQWHGDSIGHWDGDTLVVDTANYRTRSFMNLSSEKLHVMERLSRTGPDSLKYEIAIDDPGTWTKPFSLMIPLKRSPDPLYEYACHEGNIGLAGILAGARAEERAAASVNQSK